MVPEEGSQCRGVIQRSTVDGYQFLALPKIQEGECTWEIGRSHKENSS